MKKDRRKRKEKLAKEIVFEVLASLIELKFIVPAVLIAGAAGYVAYDYGFDAGAESIVCPELDCMECLDEFDCDDLERFGYCFECPPCPELDCITCVKGLDCDDLNALRPDCDFYECPECPEVDCDYCCDVLDCIC